MAVRALALAGIPPAGQVEARLLEEVVAAAAAVLPILAREEEGPRLEAGSRFLYRRWVLESLLVLRARGPAGFNDLKRALGSLAGESLAPKLADLTAWGLVRKSQLGGSPRRVLYALTPEGEDVAAAALALTSAKIEHARAIESGEAPRALAGLRAPRGDVDSFRAAVRAFARERLERTREVEERLRRARRFTQACVHKWHGSVLVALAAGGPMRFERLLAATGAGDQSLANALRALEALGSVERADGSWRILPLGLLDLCVGAATILLLPRAPLQAA